jgi:predicted 3-demethylubiquinone-9 3-methyltransferase (glyoxalase superfamily)
MIAKYKRGRTGGSDAKTEAADHPSLWFDHQAEEATNFYVSIFRNSRVGSSARYSEEGAKTTGRPTCSVMTVAFERALGA